MINHQRNHYTVKSATLYILISPSLLVVYTQPTALDTLVILSSSGPVSLNTLLWLVTSVFHTKHVPSATQGRESVMQIRCLWRSYVVTTLTVATETFPISNLDQWGYRRTTTRKFAQYLPAVERYPIKKIWKKKPNLM